VLIVAPMWTIIQVILRFVANRKAAEARLSA
jgi:hypothetical protein